MEININCDLGEKSKHHSNKYDPDLLEIVNSANVACGYHAGDEATMNEVVQISKKNGVSIGAHPSFNDPENFGRSRINLANVLAKTIYSIDKELIYLVPTGSKMEIAAQKLNMKIACEIFADRNYEDDGNLVSRKKSNALIIDPEEAKKHVLTMVQEQALNCFSGKKIPCEIDSVCIHGDNISSLATAKSIKENLVENGLVLKRLSSMSKFN